MILGYGGCSIGFPMGRNPAPMITTFPQASLRSRTVGFPDSGSDLGAIPRSPSRNERGLSAGPHTPHSHHSLLPVARSMVCSTGSVSRSYARNHQVPRAPLPARGVTSLGVACCVTSEGVTPPSSLLRAHAPDPLPSPAYGHASSAGLCRLLASPCWTVALPSVISANLSPDAWPLTPAVPMVRYSFLPIGHRPSPMLYWVGTPQLSAQRLQYGR